MAVQSPEHLRRQPSKGQVCYSITGRIGGEVQLPGVRIQEHISQAEARYATQVLVE
jgi:hypothetical protein